MYIHLPKQKLIFYTGIAISIDQISAVIFWSKSAKIFSVYCAQIACKDLIRIVPMFQYTYIVLYIVQHIPDWNILWNIYGFNILEIRGFNIFLGLMKKQQANHWIYFRYWIRLYTVVKIFPKPLWDAIHTKRYETQICSHKCDPNYSLSYSHI